MSFFEAGTLSTAGVKMLAARELALAADLAAWAGDEDRCIAIIDRIYAVLDGLHDGYPITEGDQALCADAAAWVGDRKRCRAINTGISEASLPGWVNPAQSAEHATP